jgi:hypothetical protein
MFAKSDAAAAMAFGVAIKNDTQYLPSSAPREYYPTSPIVHMLRWVET